MALNNTHIKKLFFIFLLIHLVVWTLIPSVTNNNLPLDTIEALAWGSNLDWGFDISNPQSRLLPQARASIVSSGKLLFVTDGISVHTTKCIKRKMKNNFFICVLFKAIYLNLYN